MPFDIETPKSAFKLPPADTQLNGAHTNAQRRVCGVLKCFMPHDWNEKIGIKLSIRERDTIYRILETVKSTFRHHRNELFRPRRVHY